VEIKQLSKTKRLPAIILGADITALGVIRCLSRQNVKTFYISDKNDFVKCSRWTDPITVSMAPFPTAEDITKILESLDIERAVLFPCSDSFLNAVVELPPEVKSRFLSSLPSQEVLDTFVNKGKFARVLKEADIPHPETVIIDSADKIKNLDSEYFDNFFLKPFNSKEFQHYFHIKAIRVFSRDDALNKFNNIHKKVEFMMLQKYIPGPANEHYFIDGFMDRGGDVRTLFARKRERIYPPDFGNSSYCVSVPLDTVSDALESNRKLLKHIGYRGIFSAEFKFDRRDNLFKILEVNARPWWYIEFAAQCGVDTCQMAYLDALGEPVAPVGAYREGVGCMYSFDDFRVALRMFFKGDLSCLTWCRQFLTAKKPIYSLDDPFPALCNFLARPVRFIRRKF